MKEEHLSIIYIRDSIEDFNFENHTHPISGEWRILTRIFINLSTVWDCFSQL